MVIEKTRPKSAYALSGSRMRLRAALVTRQIIVRRAGVIDPRAGVRRPPWQTHSSRQRWPQASDHPRPYERWTMPAPVRRGGPCGRPYQANIFPTAPHHHVRAGASPAPTNESTSIVPPRFVGAGVQPAG